MNNEGFKYLADIAVATVLFRVVLGLLVSHRGLLRFLFFAVLLSLAIWGANWLELRVARWLVYGLAVPVSLLLFANLLPELRRLYQAARLGHLFGYGGSSATEILPELSSALVDMAKNRIGAILVFPGSEDLEELVHGGESIRAKVNKSLLLSIFNTASPRHDGAVIIRHDEIHHIGAVLPLATADRARSEWGTRHLAALGLAQRSDAHVIVISEERGTISHAFQGELREIRPVNERTVAAVLARALGLGADERTRRSRRFFAACLWLAAILGAMGGAVFLDTIQPPPVEIRTIAVSIAVTKVPLNLNFEGAYPTSVDVAVQVPAVTPGIFSNPDLKFEVDLTDYAEGLNRIELTAAMIKNLPATWVVTSISPPQVTITLGGVRQFAIPVEAKYTGLPDDLTVGEIRIDPTTIPSEVRDSAWTDKDTLKTKPIDLTGITEPMEVSFTREIQFPERVKPLSGSERVTVRVTLDVIQKRR
jgi:DNA integrity scanning protein DisA with diadenylate cyclase activity